MNTPQMAPKRLPFETSEEQNYEQLSFFVSKSYHPSVVQLQQQRTQQAAPIVLTFRKKRQKETAFARYEYVHVWET